ncbi:unnamed protein product [Adineta steineri]|uniref:Ketosynthase family 3 (KS3) domain-containing protein n=1 Tax=Adineta steineri TaxID=433720 RepID=A0A814KUE3_9BILA|nr:unnamed protein product [Adineta steineri]CAF1167019.1 unnamed protein product [Adineta steineri]
MATINNNSTSLEPIAVIGIACEFAGDIYYANDLWYTLKESQDAGSAITIDRFDLESFIGHMLNMDNNGQLHQKLLRADAEPANIDPCHRSPILKFVDLLDGDGYSIEKIDAERDGDPIEANCLDRFFNRSNLDPPLLLDLIKSNLGHTEGAAGVISLIKVAMCMYHRGITTNIQFTSLNPKIEAQKYNLHILQNFLPFPSVSNNEKTAIGVNLFETVGSTTHSIIEEYQSNKTSIENGYIDENHIKSR